MSESRTLRDAPDQLLQLLGGSLIALAGAPAQQRRVQAVYLLRQCARYRPCRLQQSSNVLHVDKQLLVSMFGTEFETEVETRQAYRLAGGALLNKA